MSTDERVSNLKEAAFASEMARRRAVGALRANRKSLGALIQVLLHRGDSPATNVYLKEAIGMNLTTYGEAEQSDEEYGRTLRAIAALDSSYKGGQESVSREERTSQALDHLQAGRKAINEADMEPDQKVQEQLDNRAALHFMKAAALLVDAEDA